jgi:hypothetical protein
MKTRILIILPLLIWSIIVPGYGQTYEKEVKGITYVFNEENKTVENKANYLTAPQSEAKFVNPNKNHFSLDFQVNLNTIYRKVFPKERVKELSGKAIAIDLINDSLGKIMEIRFYLSNCFTIITPEEIYWLEYYLKNTEIDFNTECKDQDVYYNTFTGLNFERLYKSYK